jgi:hypothetical protein
VFIVKQNFTPSTENHGNVRQPPVLKGPVPQAVARFAIGDQVMVGSCRRLKKNVDELTIERICYERVTD